jgi:penicillin-binding protein 1A
MAFFRRRGVRILLGVTLISASALVGGVVVFYLALIRDLPDLRRIEDYNPPVVTEIFDRHGQRIAEFAVQRRRLVELDRIPVHTQLAFVAAEDGGFFEHRGIDTLGMLRAALANLRAGGTIKQGASTITQQMVKSLLLSPERTYRRKIREIYLALQIERNLSKDVILYLYLNQIYFGSGAWGIAEAARTYFDMTVDQLGVSESALLAGLPQRPTAYSPFRNPEAAESRRRYVLGRMLHEEMIDAETYDLELARLPVIKSPAEREDYALAAYFNELVRRYLYQRFGGDLVLGGGLRIETSLDLELQRTAVAALRGGLEAHDRRQGYRGPLRRVDPDEIETEIARIGDENAKLLPNLIESDAKQQLAEPTANAADDPTLASLDLGRGGDERFELPFAVPLVGVVTNVDAETNVAHIALGPELAGEVAVADVRWAREPDRKTRGHPVAKIGAIFAAGDVLEFVRLEDAIAEDDGVDEIDGPAPPRLGVHQVPVVQGSLLSIENRTGDVLALVGGYDFEKSQFDRVTQGRRQPGSSFKPFIYGAALSRGYTAVEQLVDRPVVYVDPVSGFKYKPKNYGRKFYGPISMRRALAKSVNNATMHLFRDVGVDYVIDYARRFGIESALSRDLSLALGSSAVTLLELTRAYAIFPAGGRRVVPRFITRVTDRNGETLLEDVPLGEPPPPLLKPLIDPKDEDAELEPYPDGEILPTDRVISEAEAYLMCDLLRAVVKEGTGRGLLRLGGHLAGKTGTTNEQADAWFAGFSPDVTTGVWVGHDQVRALGFGETGARAALPIWRDFMREVMRRSPIRDFEEPDGIIWERVDPESGLLASASTRNAYFQPFLEGTEPTERVSERTNTVDTERTLRSEAF